jgi:hypothetical protein
MVISADDRSLAALMTRAVNRASTRTLAACAVAGSLAIVAPWALRVAHVFPTALGFALLSFGIHGLATHALAVDRAPGLVAVARLSAVIGAVATTCAAFWLFFRLLGNSFWN